MRLISYLFLSFHIHPPFLSYLHINGFIHRDIKAANLLIDDDGTVLLGDLGVAADLSEDTSSRSHSKSTSTDYQLTSPTQSIIAGKRPPLLDNSASVPIRPRIGKRKSFVGTVSFLSRSALNPVFNLI